MASLTFSGTGQRYHYDFSSGGDMVNGGQLCHKELAPGIWGMISGNGNADETVSVADKNDVWNPEGGLSGYCAGDFNLDGFVDNNDKLEQWTVNAGRQSQVTGSWTCGQPFADIRDGRIYGTILIGNQCWMSQNLNAGTMIIGTTNMTHNGITEKYCYYNSNVHCRNYGGLYQWNEMMQYLTNPGVQGICPGNWHLPADGEWCQLEQSVDSTIQCNVIGWRGLNGGLHLMRGGTSGCDAIMAGRRTTSGYFSFIGAYTYFWTSSRENISICYPDAHRQHALGQPGLFQ